MDASAADLFLPEVYLSDVSGFMPVYTYLFAIRYWSHPEVRTGKRTLACHTPHTPLPSVGRKRLRSGTIRTWPANGCPRRYYFTYPPRQGKSFDGTMKAYKTCNRLPVYGKYTTGSRTQNRYFPDGIDFIPSKINNRQTSVIRISYCIFAGICILTRLIAWYYSLSYYKQ